MQESTKESQKFVLSREDKVCYQMLGRLRMDYDYFLGNGQIYGNHLWVGNDNIHDQIECMKAIWNSFPEEGKTEWFIMEQIEQYEEDMREIQILNQEK